jgi:hypothetical protein
VGDVRGIEDRGLGPPPPSREDPEGWFRAAGTVYSQGVQAPFGKTALSAFGGTLELAALDREAILAGSTNWLGFSDYDLRRAHTRQAWARHEDGIRALMAGGMAFEDAVITYYRRVAGTRPETTKELVSMGNVVARAPGATTAYVWSYDVIRDREIIQGYGRAFQEANLGATVESVRSLADPPESMEDLDAATARMYQLDAVLSVGTGMFPVESKPQGRPGRYQPQPTPPAVGQAGAPPPGARTPTPTPLAARGIPETPAVLDVKRGTGGEWSGEGVAPSDSLRATGPPERGLATPTPAPRPALPSDAPPSPSAWTSRLEPSLPDPVQVGLERSDPSLGLQYKLNRQNNLLALIDSRWRRLSPDMPPSSRARYGYSNSQLDEAWKGDLLHYWVERGLARPAGNGQYEMYDIELRRWLPQSQIDLGHIVTCVEHHNLLKPVYERRMQSDPEAAERWRQSAVRTFMRSFDNYVPQESARNRALGRGIGLTYDGHYPDWEYGESGRVPR